MNRLAGVAAVAGLAFTIACAQTDAGITANVKSRLAADDAVRAYEVDVDTREGVVTLTGQVDTVAQKEQAVEIARNTEGVRDVLDQIRVGETAPTTGLDDPDVEPGDRLEQGAREGADAIGDAGRRGADAVREGADRIESEVDDER